MMIDRRRKIYEAYKSSKKVYDDALTANGFWFKVYNKIIWGMKDEDYVERLLSFIPDGFEGNLLDVPVGTGVFTTKKYLKIQEANIFAIDYSSDMLHQAQNRFKNAGIKNVNYIQGDVGQLPFESDSFDMILSMNGFHAFPDKEKAVEDILRVLKQGGTFCGCFYIKGERKLTDFVVNNILVPGGWFTPPFVSLSELKVTLEKYYVDIKVYNIKSIAYFTCIKRRAGEEKDAEGNFSKC